MPHDFAKDFRHGAQDEAADGAPLRSGGQIASDLWAMAEELGEIGSFDRDLVTGLARVSDNLCRIYGVERSVLEAPDEYWLSAIHPADRPGVDAVLRETLGRRSRDARYRYRIRRPSGELRLISTYARIEYDADGNAIRRYGVNQDVTERFDTTMANAHLAAVVASSSEAIKSYSLDGRILSWNPGAERLFGYTAQEALGAPIDIIVPDDQREEARRKLKLVATGEDMKLETTRRRKDGSLVQVAISASPVRDASGSVVAVSALAHDIGPRKAGQRALERYRLLAEHARDILLVMRLSDRAIIETNAAAVAAYGYTRDELLSKRIEDLRAPEALASLQGDIERIGAGTLFETRHMRADGSTFPVEVSAVAMDIEGEGMVLSLIRDTSERHEWQRVQRLMTRELLHRVKNSVAVIQSLVRLTAPRARSLDEFVSSLTGRLSAMAAAHDLLTEMHWRGADLGELVAKQLAHYLSAAERRVNVEGAAVRVPQQFAVPLALALHELATNAAKHGSLSTPQGRVDLTWRKSGPGEETLLIEWRESGGPAVAKPAAAGFGSTLIERGMAGARVERSFDEMGMTCRIEIDIDTAAAVRRGRAARKG